MIKKLNEQFELLEKALDTPTEEDLDNIYDCLNTLNRCEWLVETTEEANKIKEVYDLIKKYYDEVWNGN